MFAKPKVKVKMRRKSFRAGIHLGYRRFFGKYMLSDREFWIEEEEEEEIDMKSKRIEVLGMGFEI